jgi:endogenous inhibitor of DNA gyrase (YacG/DUF329 family)
MSSQCPLCGKAVDPAARPFCSKRCADLDLQRWLSDRYIVPGTDEDEENPLSEEIVRNDD